MGEKGQKSTSSKIRRKKNQVPKIRERKRQAKQRKLLIDKAKTKN